MNIQVVVIAGGLGTRLGKLGRERPKSLVEISGIPFIQLQMELIKDWGVKRVLLCLGNGGEKIVSWIEKFDTSGLNFDFSFDGEEPLGTGGALVNAIDKLENSFVIVYGDSYPLVDFQRVYRQFLLEKKNSMCVSQSKYEDCPNNIKVNQDLVVEYSKENKQDENFSLIDYGVIFLHKSTLITYKKGHNFDLSLIIKDLIQRRDLLAIQVHEDFFEVGTEKGIQRLENFLGMMRK